MRVYYNEIDSFAAEWLRNLMAAGLIPAGDIDERSIADVRPDDVRGYDQCHFFAGIGGWPYALDLAGWGDQPVWTGSCPCQPFSSAGKQSGGADDRHLWPAWFRLIRECRPDCIIGEQVEGAVGFGWLDRVFADLEAEGYACGAAVLGAHSVGAPHRRQRLFWVADAGRPDHGRLGEISRSPRTGETASPRQGRNGRDRISGGRGATGELGDAEGWVDAEWLPCLDGKARRVEPSIFPLAYAGEWGIGSRVGLLRGAGNAIVPKVAAEFVKAFLQI